jgi:DmsE family decaheme c-type cytochrome
MTTDLLKDIGMQINRSIAAVGLCLFALLAPPAWAAGETGAKLCVTCHDEEDLPDMSRTAHGFSADKRTPDCISCHGPSPTHAKKPADVKERPRPDRMFIRSYASPPAERNAACLNCHNKDPQRALWASSQHAGADLACNSCHKIHANRDKVLSKATQTEVCYSCHKEQRTQLNKASHHPIPEGKMSCADCHNVHGSAGPKLVKRDSTNATCYTCHAEKRGPFVHQHEPVVEDCANCHNPHGSNVAALLKARPPLLCQQCHTPHVAGSVGALAGQSGVSSPAAGLTQPLINATSSGKNVVNLWQGRSCLNCHTQIHGSNNPSMGNPTPQLMLR